MTFTRTLIMMSVFGLVALAVSAQTPGVPMDKFVLPASPDNAPSNSMTPPSPYYPPLTGTAGYSFGSFSRGPRPEELELARTCEVLIKQLAKAEGQDKEKVRTNITNAITELETQLKKLKEMVQKRQDNRKEIVGKRFDQLVRESEGLGW
jgi:ElaB/YqjD/DUF883 family membrane-anchored ribosome-binding protein